MDFNPPIITSQVNTAMQMQETIWGTPNWFSKTMDMELDWTDVVAMRVFNAMAMAKATAPKSGPTGKISSTELMFF